MERQELIERICQADMVLVGLGEDFDDRERLRQDETWRNGRDLLKKADVHWMLPAWNEYCSARLDEDVVTSALERLIERLEGKNCFLVSVSTNMSVRRLAEDRLPLVMPCGGTWMKQCSEGCEGELYPIDPEDRAVLGVFLEKLYQRQADIVGDVPSLGRCSRCGSSMVLNNVYGGHYNEKGYLEEWTKYTRWLQETLNRSLFVLELGVRMDFPSVIRWPFEKIVRYNQKAFLCRVSEDLYQLPKDLSTKGVGISKNTIDWLREL